MHLLVSACPNLLVTPCAGDTLPIVAGQPVSPVVWVDPRQPGLVLAALHRLLLTSRSALTASSCLPRATSSVEHCVVRTCFAAATFDPRLPGHCTSILSLVLSAGKPAQASKEQTRQLGTGIASGYPY